MQNLEGCCTKLVTLAEEHGTPLVVYDGAALRDTMRRYLTAFRAHDPHAEVIYASKAFWAQALLRMVGVLIEIVRPVALSMAR